MSRPRQTAFDHPNRSAEDIFEILVSENAPMLIAYIRSMVWRSEVADDLFQETMIVAWRRLDDFDRTRPFAPWLRGIALRICLAHRRKHARDMLRCEPEVLDSLEAKFRATGQDDANSFRDRIKKLQECMKRLPAPMREVIELGYGRGMLLKEIANSLDSTTEAIKKRVQRARQNLSRCIQQED